MIGVSWAGMSTALSVRDCARFKVGDDDVLISSGYGRIQFLACRWLRRFTRRSKAHGDTVHMSNSCGLLVQTHIGTGLGSFFKGDAYPFSAALVLLGCKAKESMNPS